MDTVDLREEFLGGAFASVPPVHLARQSIFDREKNLFAYELLFRDSSSSDSAVINNGLLATAQVLEGALNRIGLSDLLGNCKGFVNCSREMLLGKFSALMNPKRFVLEILENVLPEPEILEALRILRAKGFEFALDDFIFNEENCKVLSPYFPFISYVKIDFLENSREARARAAKFFKERGISLLAEKVETEEVFKECLDAGYDYFQGFLLARPEVLEGRASDLQLGAVFHLLRSLRKEPTFSEFCDEVSKYPELADDLIHYVETSRLPHRRAVDSVRMALEWIGMRNVHEWLMLLLYVRFSGHMFMHQSPKFRNVLHRAKFMENLAYSLKEKECTGADAFLLGILSRIKKDSGTLLENLLDELEASPSMREALLSGTGTLGNLLRLTDAVEEDDRGKISECLSLFSLSNKILQECVKEAFTWAAYA